MKRRVELSLIMEVDTPEDGAPYRDLVDWVATIPDAKQGKSTIKVMQFMDTHDWEDLE